MINDKHLSVEWEQRGSTEHQPADDTFPYSPHTPTHHVQTSHRAITNKPGQTRNPELGSTCILQEPSTFTGLRRHIRTLADTASTREPGITTKRPHSSCWPSPPSTPRLTHTQRSVCFLKLHRRRADGKLPLEAWTLQSLWMREVIALNYIAGIFPLSFQFQIPCLCCSHPRMPLPHTFQSHLQISSRL